MAKYIYKNTHFFATMDPKKIIKMFLKVLYASWGPTACYSMNLFQVRDARSRPEATMRRPILPKIMRQKSFNTINHWI